MSLLTYVTSTLVKCKLAVTGSIERLLSDILSESMSVKDFGAKGDGVTDDSDALQAAMDASATAGYRLKLTSGNYRILKPLVLPSNLYMVGDGTSEIYLDPAMTVGASFGGIERAIYAIDKSNITLRKVNFRSSRSNFMKRITIAFLRCSNINVLHCNFDDFGGRDGVSSEYAQGLIMFETTDIVVSHSRFRNCSGDGLAYSNNCLRHHTSFCQFISNGDWGLAIVEGSNNGVITGNLFINNVSTATGSDRSSNLTFSSNVMINNEHGVRICEFASSSDVFQQVTIIGNDIAQSNYGISVENARPQFGNFSVIGNTVKDSNQQGIQVVDSQLGTIVGNTVYSSSNAAILINALTPNKVTGLLSISGNTLCTAKYGIQEIQTVPTAGLAHNVVSGNNISAMSTSATALIDGNTSAILMDSTTFIKFNKSISLPSGITSLVANSGGTPLPVNAQGFLTLYFDDGTPIKVPYYKN